LPILKLCFRWCDTFSLTDIRGKSSVYDSMKNELQNALRPYLIRDFHTGKWFAYQKVKPPLHICLYRTAPEAIDILCRYYRHLFGSGFMIPEQNMEDLCFFSENVLILGTLSHHQLCCVYPPTEGFEKELRAIWSGWEYLEREKDPINLRHFR